MSSQSLAFVRFAERHASPLGVNGQIGAGLHRTASPAPNGTRRVRADRVVISVPPVIVAHIQPAIMQHGRRVATLARQIAQALSLPGSVVNTISVGALLHDIGKTRMPATLLDKPDELSDAEWNQVKQHPEIGYQMLRNTSGLEAVAPCVRHHHERYDGTGYPAGLAGAAIPLGARILAVSDAVDAMRSRRPYRRALSLDETVAEVRRQAGRQFDPGVVNVFLQQVLPQTA